MSSTIHSSQEKTGCWVHSCHLDQKVFIEDIPSNQKVTIYENPDFKENHDQVLISELSIQLLPQLLPPGSSVTIEQTTSLPKSINSQQVETLPINVPQAPAAALHQTRNLTSSSTAVESASHVASRSTSRTTEPSTSVSSQSSRSSVTKQNGPKSGPKKGDKIVATRPFQSSDKHSIQIKTNMVMEVKRVESGNLLVDCRDWVKMHWIQKNDVKYLRRYRAPKRRVRSKSRIEEFILNRDAVMRSGPNFDAPVITNLSAESSVLVNMKTYSKVENVIHKGQNKKRILVKAKDQFGNVNMGWITMSTEKGPMCRRRKDNEKRRGQAPPERKRRPRRFRY